MDPTNLRAPLSGPTTTSETRTGKALNGMKAAAHVTHEGGLWELAEHAAVKGALSCLGPSQQAWELHVYNLTVSYDPTGSNARTIQRPHMPVSAAQALKDWADEEATGYLVTCKNGRGTSVTKSQLRDEVRRA